jgi:hypothetical protein
MVDIQTISIAIASASVALAAIYYIWQIRHQTKLRETDLAIRLFSILNDREFGKDYGRVRHCEFKDYDDFVKRYGSIWDWDSEKELELKSSFGQVLNTAELFGFLLKRKAVDADFLYEVFPGLGLWEKVKPVVEGERRKYNVPGMFEGFEYYYNEMKKREQKLQPTS